MSTQIASILAFFKGLPGITRNEPSGSGAVIGCDDRWVFEVQPEDDRWSVACRVGRGKERRAVGWTFDRVTELEANREAFAWIATHEVARLTPQRVAAGRRYVVVQAFTDHAGTKFSPGQKLECTGREPLVIAERAPSLANALAGALGRTTGEVQGVVLCFGAVRMALHDLQQSDVVADFADFVAVDADDAA